MRFVLIAVLIFFLFVPLVETQSCFKNELLECSPDGSEWTLIQECEFGCEDGSCKERPLEINYLWLIPIGIMIIFGLLYTSKHRRGLD